ncbi:hypothetical protein [uncultured Metabacillus sp.]|nr:hypothetical protein [uncultured Metabacillus sp.]
MKKKIIGASIVLIVAFGCIFFFFHNMNDSKSTMFFPEELD